MQTDEDTYTSDERGKFSRRKIESNWSRYGEVAEGEDSSVPSVGAMGHEESSAAMAREDESRSQQEDLRFKQLVESASEECTG